MQIPIQLWKTYTSSDCTSSPQVYVWNTQGKPNTSYLV